MKKWYCKLIYSFNPKLISTNLTMSSLICSFLEGSVVDHRDVKLQAVKLRYGEEKFHQVSEIPIMSYEELCAMLGVTEHIVQGTDVCVKFRNADELILSPSRKKRKCER